VSCKTCRIKVEINAGAVSAQSMSFEIFDSGLPLGQRQAEISNITTSEFNLGNYQSAKLAFWHKYDLLTTENGGVILVGNSTQKDTGYTYHYVTPKKSYPGNLRLDKTILDDDGTRMLYAYNSKSAGQTFNWVYDEVDLTPFIDPSTPWIRVRFSLYVWGYGNGGGWWLDDVQVKVSRADSTPITSAVADQWEYYEWDSMVDPAEYQPHSGTYMWWNHDPTNNHDLASGIDSSLTTKSIDLTNAMDASISAYFKFNIDDDAGRPPDGFRTEVSSDNGVTWRPVNLGVRSSWGVSGDWSTDGKSPDGTKAYTGIQDNGLDSNTPVWVEADTLWRLNINLSGWSGSVIKIRFRIVTNLDATHHQSATNFRGFAVDDVIVRGNTTTSNAPMPPPPARSSQWDKEHIDHGGLYDPEKDVGDMSISIDPNIEKAAIWKDR
jgi:hypothetical protein